LRIASRPALHLLQTVSPGMRMDELCSRRHLGKTWYVSAGRWARTRPIPKQTFGRQDRSSPGAVFVQEFPRNPVKLVAVPARGAFFLGHGLDVGAMQRGCRPEAVEDDADGAAIAARANDGPFPAGEIWASQRAECGQPDAGRRREPLFGRPCRRSRTVSHCGAHLFGRR